MATGWVRAAVVSVLYKGSMSQSPASTTNEEKFWKHLLKLEAKDVNLKFVFDHIRNYGICGLMLGIGMKVLAHTDISNVLTAFLDLLAGGLLFALPWALFALNLLHGVYAFFVILDAPDMKEAEKAKKAEGADTVQEPQEPQKSQEVRKAKDAKNWDKYGYLAFVVMLFLAAFKLMLYALNL